MRGLYIHVPFCSGKCFYCAFLSRNYNAAIADRYIFALACEARKHKSFKPSVLYIGGGTPSELSCRQIKKLFEIIDENFGSLKKFKEITFEVNPESVSAEKAGILKQAGVSRISIGLQSPNKKSLKTLGRRHNLPKFLSAYKILQNAGFENINIDIIAGIPGETLRDFCKTLDLVSRLKPAHISVYGLETEESSEFYRRDIYPDELLSEKMLKRARKFLTAKNYRHYEISNFALKGKESLHNINYWDNGEYLGLGAGAAGYINGVRTKNTCDMEKYISEPQNAVVFSEKLKGKEKAGEALMVGLRKLDGVKLTRAMKQYFNCELEKLTDEGRIVIKNNKARIAEKHIYLSNEIFRRFVLPFD